VGGRLRGGSGWVVPIALKFASFIAILIVASMAWQANTAIEVARDHLEDKVTKDGIARVGSIVGLIDPDWLVKTEETTERDIAKDVAQLSKLLKSFAGGPDSDDRLQDIVVFSESHKAILATARGTGTAGAQRRSEGTQIVSEAAKRAVVTITEFKVDDVPVRSFSHEIFADANSKHASTSTYLGKVEVLLSAKEIEDASADLVDSLTRVTVIACLAATVAAFLLASLLTRPIRILGKDMRHVSLGNLQHQTSVNSRDELGGLARTFNVMVGNLQSAEAAKVQQKALEHELSLATDIQSRLLPDQIPVVDGIDISAFYLSAKEVGGDYYDFLPIDDQHLGVVIADVSGKGVPGSLVMTMTRSLLRMASRGEPSPDTTLQEVNRCLSSDMSPGMFVTLAYLVLNKRTREVLLTRAGHNAPLLFNARHQKLINLHPRGIAIGLDRGGTLFDSQLEVQRFRLHSDDVLVLYTDGIVEGKDRHGNDFGDQRLESLIIENHDASARDLVEIIVDDLSHHQRGTERSDDITLLVLKSA
jgi:serine phosphatase RsbU (regulator of sigma subunit)